MNGPNSANAPGAAVPTLSICVPTFNRAQGLRNLLRNLQAAKTRFGDLIEVCVSNNHSVDDTSDLLDEFRDPLALRIVHQASNIGGTLNMIAVAQLARGHWTLLIGDDDELLIDNVALLIEYLKRAGPNDWVLAGVANASGREHILGNLHSGRYPKADFRRTVLRTSLHRYGFMGMHVFPASARPTFARLTLEQAQPWPHISALLRELEHGEVHVFEPPIMIQANGSAKLFWNAADLARITLSRLRILALADKEVRGHSGFHRALMLRELYSLPNLGLLLAWKMYEPGDYRAEALRAYSSGYQRTGALLPFALPHFSLVLLLRCLPHALLSALFRMAGRGHYLARYAARKSELGDFDGIKRGI